MVIPHNLNIKTSFDITRAMKVNSGDTYIIRISFSPETYEVTKTVTYDSKGQFKYSDNTGYYKHKQEMINEVISELHSLYGKRIR